MKRQIDPTLMKTILILGLFSLTLPLHAGWIVEQDAARIKYVAEQGKGYDSFDDALKNMSDSSRIQKLDVIVAFPLLSDETFQAELLAGLEQDAPRELREAQKSAGNMHNPKMIQLWKPFEKALLATPTIAKLNTSLAVYGITISRPGIEKFELRSIQDDSKRRFHGLLWLYVTQLPDKGPHPAVSGNKDIPYYTRFTPGIVLPRSAEDQLTASMGFLKVVAIHRLVFDRRQDSFDYLGIDGEFELPDGFEAVYYHTFILRKRTHDNDWSHAVIFRSETVGLANLFALGNDDFMKALIPAERVVGAKPADAGQPPAKPVDQPPVNDQPATHTSKEGPAVPTNPPSQRPTAEDTVIKVLDTPLPSENDKKKKFLWDSFAKPDENKFNSYTTEKWQQNYEAFSAALVKKTDELKLDSSSLRKALDLILKDPKSTIACLPVGAYQSTLDGKLVWIVTVKWGYPSLDGNGKSRHLEHIRVLVYEQKSLKQVGFVTCK